MRRPAAGGARLLAAARARLLFAGATCALLLLAASSRAQDASPLVGPSAGEAPTSLQSYLEQPGRLLVERRFSLPAIAVGELRVTLEAVIAFEPAREHERVLGVRARVSGPAGSRTVHLDLHEVEDFERSLGALPGVVNLERAQKAAVEIRYTTRDGLGFAVSTGASPSRRVLRLPGPPLIEAPLSDKALEELRAQLDACRRYLWEAPADAR